MGLNSATFSSLVHACTKHGENKYAKETFEKMQPAGVVPNVPNVVAFNSSDIKKAEKVFPDGATFCSLIAGCAKHGEAARTVEIFETMRTAGMVLNANLSGKAAGRHTLRAAALERCRHAGSGNGRGTAPAKGNGKVVPEVPCGLATLPPLTPQAGPVLVGAAGGCSCTV